MKDSSYLGSLRKRANIIRYIKVRSQPLNQFYRIYVLRRHKGSVNVSAQMATVFPRWKVILVGVCSLVLSCLLLLTVSHITSSVGTLYSQPDVKARQLVVNPVFLPPSRRRLAEENSSKWGNASRYGYTPLAEPTDAIAPTGISIVRTTKNM